MSRKGWSRAAGRAWCWQSPGNAGARGARVVTTGLCNACACDRRVRRARRHRAIQSRFPRRARRCRGGVVDHRPCRGLRLILSTTPAGITQEPPRRDRVRYAVAALRAALTQTARSRLLRPSLYGAACALIARLKGAKLIVQMHGIEAWPRPSRLQRAAVEAADLVLCVSRFTRACVLGWAAIAPERLVVLPNTVGEAFTPGDGSSSAGGVGTSGQTRAADGRADGLARALQGP